MLTDNDITPTTNALVINGEVYDYRDLPERVTILFDAAVLTMGDRQKTYGDFTDNMTFLGQGLESLFGRAVSAHNAALTMLVSKLSRIRATYPDSVHRDNYVDGVNYLAAAYEADTRTRVKELLYTRADSIVDSEADESLSILFPEPLE